jgi:hypothetical protein
VKECPTFQRLRTRKEPLLRLMREEDESKVTTEKMQKITISCIQSAEQSAQNSKSA